MALDKSRSLDYKKIGGDFLSLVQATANKLEREWPKRYENVEDANFIFALIVRYALQTYMTITYICAEKTDRMHSLSAAPLTRVIYEQLISLIYLLDDVPSNIPAYLKSGYYSYVRELENIQQYNTIPKWQTYIATLEAELKRQENALNLTPLEISHPKDEIGLWFTPGGFKNKLEKKYKGATPPDYLPFISYMNAWLYRELSGETHGDYKALAGKGVFLSRLIAKNVSAMFDSEEQVDERTDFQLETLRHDQVYNSMTLMLSIVTEIEIHFKFGLAERAKVLWAILSDNSDSAKEIYEFRYALKLARHLSTSV